MVRELEPGSLVEATFAVTRKVRRSRKDGRAYLDIELADRSGRVRARVWEAVELLDGRFATGDTVRVLGRVGSYEGKVELELRDVERLPDGDPARAGARRPPRRRRPRRLPRLPDRRDPRRRAARRRRGDPLRHGLPRALPRRRRDRVGPPCLRGRADRAHRRGHGPLPRDRAVAARSRHGRADGRGPAARLRHARRARRRARRSARAPRARAGARAHGAAPDRGGGGTHAATAGAACSRCSRASRRTTDHPRGGASRARRPSRCTPRTPSTHVSPRRAARSASSQKSSELARAGDDAEPDRAGDAGAAEAAVAAGVLLRGTAGGTPRPGRTGRPRRSPS